MTCGKVIYHVPSNEFISSYCSLEPGHKRKCRYIPEEYIVQICKEILIERGEVIVPLKRRK